jgi:hypothetical protein
MKKIALAALALAVAFPVMAQQPPQEEPPAPAPEPQAAPVAPVAADDEVPPPPKAKRSSKGKWFAGGGFGMTFGTIDSISLSPMIGYHVIPRFDVGTQLFYTWLNDGRYEPDLETNEYGATVFARFRVFSNIFLEADYQYTNYEYFTGFGTQTDRANYDSFLAGAGYGFPMGGRASFYVSALYDFGYDDNSYNRPYDSAWRIQVGVGVGF